MFGIHRHKWSRGRRISYRPPINRPFEASGFVDINYINRLIYGYTTFEIKCTKCGKVDTTYELGNLQA